VFGVGTWYILKLMAGTPHSGEQGVASTERGRVRTAGITPGPAQAPEQLR
jgi:cytochrome d ubiquinol oxidase subunit I